MIAHRPKFVLYVRVSTAEQTSAHQIVEARRFYDIDDEHVIVDHGVSGVRTRLEEREQGRRLFDLLQAGDTLVVRWVDRLGRDYKDVSRVMRQFLDKGVSIRTVTNNMLFDAQTDDPMQCAIRDAQLAFMAALAQADAEAKAEARRAGVEHAKASSDAQFKYRGRKPSFDRAKLQDVQARLAQAETVSAIARETGLSRQAVIRIRDNPAEAEAALSRWGM